MTDDVHIDLRPRPVRKAARWVAAIILVLNGLPALLVALDLVEWTTEQVVAIQAFLGVVSAAASILFGHEAEKVVTPVSDPRDDGMAPLVPVANDYLDD